MEVDVNPRTQTLFKPTPSQTLGENHPIFRQLKIHTCNQVLIKVQKYTKNIAPWLLFPRRSKYWTETKLWMGEFEKCNTYYTINHKRRVEITQNTLCGKIPGSELYSTPSFGQSTPCKEAIAERKTNCEGVKLKKYNKNLSYILHYVSQTSGENHAKCTLWQNPRERALLHTTSWKKHNVHWSYWEYRAAWETTHAVITRVT